VFHQNIKKIVIALLTKQLNLVSVYPRVQYMAKQVGQAKGYRKDLLCTSEAFPLPSKEQFVWTKSGKPLTGSK